MVLSKLFAHADDRLARKYGVVWGDPWHDPDLAAVLPSIKAGDLTAGLALLDTPDPQLRSLRLHILSNETISLLEKLESGMDLPDPEPDLLMWAGAARTKAAWAIRTGAWAKDVDAERFHRFHEMLAPAADPLMYAARISLSPTALDQLQWYCLGMDLPREELDAVWERIMELDPDHHASKESRLQVLCPKWRGSHDEMFSFAREAVARAPLGDRSLVLIAQAHYENLSVMIGKEGLETYGAVSGVLEGYYRDPSVRAEIIDAADRWVAGPITYPLAARDAHTFGSALHVAGDHQRAAAVLSLAGPLVPESGSHLWRFLDSHSPAYYARTRARLLVPLPRV
ncbi:hypothetical protein ACWGSK_19220 [Nocardiopsis sp. NPDC055551]|uniref:hypothetical protein n=1 Tax=Nocardiopsis sp. NPDC006832 TaxID=3157188 RepID=UPI00340BFCE0